MHGVSVLHYFLRQNDILSYGYTTFYLSTIGGWPFRLFAHFGCYKKCFIVLTVLRIVGE